MLQQVVYMSQGVHQDVIRVSERSDVADVGAKVPKDGQARAFWFAQGYLGEADGGTTSAMRKEAAKTFLPSHRTVPPLRRGNGQVATRLATYVFSMGLSFASTYVSVRKEFPMMR